MEAANAAKEIATHELDQQHEVPVAPQELLEFPAIPLAPLCSEVPSCRKASKSCDILRVKCRRASPVSPRLQGISTSHAKRRRVAVGYQVTALQQ